MIRVRTGAVLAVLLLTTMGVPQIRHRVINSITHIGAVCIYPWIYLGSILAKPFTDFYQRAQFFCTCEELYCGLFAEYRTLLDEHTRLLGEQVHCRETTPFVIRYAEKSLFSRVLIRRYDSGMHRILIDYGSAAGISEDLPVLDGFALVGRICAVSPLYAWVQTISDPHSRIPVYIGSRAIRGIYQGTGDIRRGRVLYVSHLEPVVMGDMVLTAGDGGIYPEGFAVGRISRIEKAGFTYVLDVDIMAQLESLDRCAIYEQAALPTAMAHTGHEN